MVVLEVFLEPSEREHADCSEQQDEEREQGSRRA
jgi:hypothetical protein